MQYLCKITDKLVMNLSCEQAKTINLKQTHGGENPWHEVVC